MCSHGCAYTFQQMKKKNIKMAYTMQFYNQINNKVVFYYRNCGFKMKLWGPTNKKDWIYFYLGDVFSHYIEV